MIHYLHNILMDRYIIYFNLLIYFLCIIYNHLMYKLNMNDDNINNFNLFYHHTFQFYINNFYQFYHLYNLNIIIMINNHHIHDYILYNLYHYHKYLMDKYIKVDFIFYLINILNNYYNIRNMNDIMMHIKYIQNFMNLIDTLFYIHI